MELSSSCMSINWSILSKPTRVFEQSGHLAKKYSIHSWSLTIITYSKLLLMKS